MSTRSETVICYCCATEITIPDIWSAIGSVLICPVCKGNWCVYVDESGESYWFGLEEVG